MIRRARGKLPATWHWVLAWIKKHRALALLLIVIIVLLALWLAPEWQASRVVGQTSVERANIEDEFRKTLATIFAGLFVVATGYIAWRNFEVAQATLSTNQEGQVTDRFTKAIQQLGATQDGKPIMEVRLGGIYALERIARDSRRDQPVIMEVLTAYVRHNASAENIERFDSAKAYKPPADIQAILTVIGRREEQDRTPDSAAVDLSFTNLRGQVCTSPTSKRQTLWTLI